MSAELVQSDLGTVVDGTVSGEGRPARTRMRESDDFYDKVHSRRHN